MSMEVRAEPPRLQWAVGVPMYHPPQWRSDKAFVSANKQAEALREMYPHHKVRVVLMGKSICGNGPQYEVFWFEITADDF